MSQGNPIAAKVARVVLLVRTKKRDIVSSLQIAGRILMRSFELDLKEVIIEKCERHLQLKQKNDIFQEALSGLDLLQLRVGEFTGKAPPDDLETVYNKVCACQTVVEVPELDALIAARPPRERLPQRELAALPEKDNGAYARKFAEWKGSTQGMAERLRAMFPPPKAKPVTFSGRQQAME
jgi:hypothetical protein